MTDIGIVNDRAKIYNTFDHFIIEKLSFLSYFL